MTMTNKPIVTIDTMNRTWIGGRILSPEEAELYWAEKAITRDDLEYYAVPTAFDRR